MILPPVRDRSNDIVSGVLHLTGVGCSIATLVILIVLSTQKSAWHVVGFALYGSGLILLYLASASYHLVPQAWIRTKQITHRLDHAMIYVLIAATYTPITFIVLGGGWRWSLFGIIWGLALIGLGIKLGDFAVSPFLSVGLYLFMGWLIVIAFSPLLGNMTGAELGFLALGGGAYTLGFIFFLLERFLPPRRFFWMHEIFHVFVLLGSASHSVVMWLLTR